MNKCENFIEEDCQYLGTILLEPPPGTVSDGLECQEMCNEYKDLGCKYWDYHRTENLVLCTKVMQETVQQKVDPILHRLVCVFDCFQVTFIH